MTEPLPAPAAALEAAYRRIRDTRMRGLPFLNERLEVQAVGFRAWEGQWLGALVTPWSINLVLLPGEGKWPALAPGRERLAVFPAGRFRFIAGTDETAGEHHACSLFSPPGEFADHATAVAVAEAAIEALFDARNAEHVDGQRAPGDPPPAVSKRDFLRGRLSGTGDGDRR